MTPEERIHRMERNGILSAAQADMLRSSLRAPTAATPPPRRQRGIWLALLVVAIALAIWLGLGIDVGTEEEVIQTVSETLNQPGGHAVNKGISTLLGVIVLLLVPILLWVWITNSLVGKEESVFEAWAQVESNYQRRSDLIPALVETTLRYLRHESKTLTGVVEARSAGLSDVDDIVEQLVQAQRESGAQLDSLEGAPPTDDEQIARLAAAQDQVSLGMRRLLAVAESYPTLRSADQFLELQAQLEGTENRINVTRMRFNQTVRDYNGAIRKLPGNLVARVNGFNRKAYFQADEGAADAQPLGLD